MTREARFYSPAARIGSDVIRQVLAAAADAAVAASAAHVLFVTNVVTAITKHQTISH